MTTHEQPLVSILTPVYNGADFLANCIESVLSQTYDNFEYIIVNNRSTDQTLEISQSYAKRDQRIRIHDNTNFVPVIANHNIAFRLISASANYCKALPADDVIFPEFVERMVEFGEAHPNVGIIGSYQLSGSKVRWQGFEYPTAVFSGVELCRRIFLGGDPTFGFGSPTSLMYRADLVRQSPEFYPNPSPHADTSACFRDLQKSDFGFVYEVLSYERIHQATQSSASAHINRYSSANLNDLLQYGSAYLSQEELRNCITDLLHGYHRFLAVAYFSKSRGKDFWDYHRARLTELGYPLRRSDLIMAALRELIRGIVNPGLAFTKIHNRIFPRPARNGASADSSLLAAGRSAESTLRKHHCHTGNATPQRM